MTDDFDAGAEPTVPAWAVFGDLMSVMLGAFVLVLLGVIGVQMELSARLGERGQAAAGGPEATPDAGGSARRAAGGWPGHAEDGRIGISGSVLFALNSDQLQPEGRALLKSLAAPLSAYLGARDEILMVSGFTDDQQVRKATGDLPTTWNCRPSGR
jgi:hypothetical protein